MWSDISRKIYSLGLYYSLSTLLGCETKEKYKNNNMSFIARYRPSNESQRIKFKDLNKPFHFPELAFTLNISTVKTAPPQMTITHQNATTITVSLEQHSSRSKLLKSN